MEADGVLERLDTINRAAPAIDRDRAAEALGEHLRKAGLDQRPVRWVESGRAARAAWAAREAREAWAAREARAAWAAWAAREARAAWAAWAAREARAWWYEMSERRALQAADWLWWLERMRGTATADEIAAVETVIGIWLPFVEATEAGLWIFYVLHDEIICVPRPAVQVVDDRLHCDDGPAIAWPNGEAYWYIRGAEVPQKVVEAPDQLTVSEISRESNLEVRRVMLERFGFDRYIRESDARLLHEDTDAKGKPRKLWRIDFPDDEPLTAVEVVNSTPEPDGTFKAYFLRVHPQLRPMRRGHPLGPPQQFTARNAVASTFGLRGEEYELAVET